MRVETVEQYHELARQLDEIQSLILLPFKFVMRNSNYAEGELKAKKEELVAVLLKVKADLPTMVNQLKHHEEESQELEEIVKHARWFASNCAEEVENVNRTEYLQLFNNEDELFQALSDRQEELSKMLNAFELRIARRVLRYTSS